MLLGNVRHQNNFNLLRLLLAFMVMLSHAPELQDGGRGRELLTQLFHTLSFGELAVDGFFLLSGYLIVQSWAHVPVPGLFLKKRILRIYPGFIVASLLCIFIVGPLGAEAARYFSELSAAKAAVGMAVLRAPVIPRVFEQLPYHQVNGAMWTIKYEFACYVAVLLVGMAGGIRRRRVWLALTVAGMAVCLYKTFGLPIPWAPLAKLVGDQFVRLATLFFAGGTFYLYRDRYSLTSRGALVALALLLPAMFVPQIAEMAVAVFGGYLLFFFAFRPIPALAGFNKLPDISYGVYLYGWPVQTLLLAYMPPQSPWVLLALAVMIVIPLAAASWYLVEEPFLRLKNRRAVLATDTAAS